MKNTQNTQKKTYDDAFLFLNEEKNLDDFLLDSEWDDDGNECGLALDSLSYGEDTDGWEQGLF